MIKSTMVSITELDFKPFEISIEVHTAEQAQQLLQCLSSATYPDDSYFLEDIYKTLKKYIEDQTDKKGY